MQSPSPTRPGGLRRPFSLITKPTGAACNLDCSYCFFLSKEALWDAAGQAMPEELLRPWLSNYLAAQPDGPVIIGWQGGEPTMRGLPFFERAVALAEELKRPRQQLQHTIQTNATLIDDAWAAFFAEHGFLVGVSLDGPAALHDRYRVNKAGRGTHAQVVRGLRVLQKHAVDVNVLCTVNAGNVGHPREVYRHFRDDLGVEFVQFIPIVERVEPGQEAVAEAGYRDEAGEHVAYRQRGAGVTSRTVDPDAYGAFLITILDEWVSRDVGRMFVQDVDVALGALFGRYSLCVHAPECGDALAMEHNGDVYSCDHYVEPGYRLGNVARDDFAAMLNSDAQRAFGRSKRTALPTQCQECPVRWACHGGCPKDRFATTADGEPGLNYLCPGYDAFYTHATPALRAMGDLLRAGRPAADIMKAAGRG